MAAFHRLTAAATLLACASGLEGAERLAIPVPSTEGRVSLGIFDARGRLVRALAQAEPVDSLNAGLDGLVFEWDGLDASGRQPAPGPLHASGFFIPNRARPRGEAFHFNDWAGDTEGGAPAEVLALIPLPGERFAIAGRLASSEGIGVWEAGEKVVLRAFHPGVSAVLAGCEQGLAAWNAADSALLWMPLFEPGGKILVRMETPPAASSRDGSLWILDPPVEAARRLLPEPATSPAPPGAELLAATGSGIFLGGDGRLWFATPAEGLRELDVAAPRELWSMSAGPEETVWITGRDEQGPCLRQISAAGEILRHLNLSPSANHARAFADPQRLRVFVLETLPGGQRVLGIEPAPNTPPTQGVADWQIICDRSISSFRDFGFSDGGVVADGAQPSPRTFSIRLSPSNWQKNPGSLSVTLESAENALWLATTSGLRLLKICEPAPRQFAACWRASEAELRILAARDAVVEEFAVENLSKIIPLDAGGISSEP